MAEYIERTEELMLAMNAGARAIENTKRYHGAIYTKDVFSESPQEIPYLQAAKVLREVSDAPAADVAPVVRCKDCKNSVEISDGSFCGACLKIHVHGAVKPFRHTFAKAHVFGRDVTVYQGDRPNTLIIKGTEPEGCYDTPGGAT
nr:MAG TPA: hypothetical protein [Caudoviricetes sp.]